MINSAPILRLKILKNAGTLRKRITRLGAEHVFGKEKVLDVRTAVERSSGRVAAMYALNVDIVLVDNLVDNLLIECG